MVTQPSVTQIVNQLKRIEQLVPPGEDAQEYLRNLLEAYIASLTPETSMGIVPTTVFSPIQAFSSARVAVEFLKDPEQLVAKPEGIVDLGILEWSLRPAFSLHDNCFEPLLVGEWKDLPGDLVKDSARSVCRIDLGMADYGFVHLGTGFVIGQNEDRLLLMTNAHVVEGALAQGWPSSTKITLACDFERFSVHTEGLHYSLAKEYHIHPSYDLALLYLPLEHFIDTTAPSILPISADTPQEVIRLQVGVLGHPSFNAQQDPFPKIYGFGGEFGVKRFSPGYICAMEIRAWRQAEVEVVLHDATTLSGSSGSCILDLGSMRVVGLHFGGWPMPERSIQVDGKDYWATLFSANGAVPLWMLCEDPLLKEVSFG